MSTGLIDQLETYFSDLDEAQGTVSEDQVAERLGNVRELPVTLTPTSNRPKLWIAVAAAAVVLVLVGVLPLLLSTSRDETPPATEPPSTVTTVAETPTTTIESAPTSVPTSAAPPAEPISIEWSEPIAPSGRTTGLGVVGVVQGMLVMRDGDSLHVQKSDGSWEQRDWPTPMVEGPRRVQELLVMATQELGGGLEGVRSWASEDVGVTWSELRIVEPELDVQLEGLVQVGPAEPLLQPAFSIVPALFAPPDSVIAEIYGEGIAVKTNRLYKIKSGKLPMSREDGSWVGALDYEVVDEGRSARVLFTRAGEPVHEGRITFSGLQSADYMGALREILGVYGVWTIQNGNSLEWTMAALQAPVLTHRWVTIGDDHVLTAVARGLAFEPDDYHLDIYTSASDGPWVHVASDIVGEDSNLSRNEIANARLNLVLSGSVAANERAVVMLSEEGSVQRLYLSEDFGATWRIIGKFSRAAARSAPVRNHVVTVTDTHLFVGGGTKRLHVASFESLEWETVKLNFEVSGLAVGPGDTVLALDRDGQWRTGSVSP